MFGFGQPPFGAQMVQGAPGMAQPPQGMPGQAPGMQQSNMAPQMPQMQRPPMMGQMPMSPMAQAPIQTHDNGLLQMLLGPSMNGQNGQALGLLKMLAQMQGRTQPGAPPNPFALQPQGTPITPPQQQGIPGQPGMPPNAGQFFNLFGGQ